VQRRGKSVLESVELQRVRFRAIHKTSISGNGLGTTHLEKNLKTRRIQNEIPVSEPEPSNRCIFDNRSPTASLNFAPLLLRR